MPSSSVFSTTANVLQVGGTLSSTFTIRRPDRAVGDNGVGAALVIRAGSSQVASTQGNLILGDLLLNGAVVLMLSLSRTVSHTCLV